MGECNSDLYAGPQSHLCAGARPPAEIQLLSGDVVQHFTETMLISFNKSELTIIRNQGETVALLPSLLG